jgi:ribonuclease-3
LSLFRGIQYFLLNDTSKHKILKSILGFRPLNIELYEQAFTHASVAGQEEEGAEESNERLEFLGDAVLGAIVAEYFFVKFPQKNEGELTKLRSKLVSRSFLNQLAIDMGLDSFLETSADTRRSKSIFGDAFEALIGAIYLDRGYQSCKKFVTEKVIPDYVEVSKLIQTESDFKSRFIELAQKEKYRFEFKNIMIQQPDHIHYRASLIINGKEISMGEGSSKKKAEQSAAKAFFKKSEEL